MFIIAHHTGLAYGLLGPQIVATYISEVLGIKTKVLGVKRGFDKGELLNLIEREYSAKERVILFSYHCGREDILELAKELKMRGFRLVKGGPQTESDFKGEPRSSSFPQRIAGFGEIFDLFFCGPVENLTREILLFEKGLKVFPWRDSLYTLCDWDNLFYFGRALHKIHPEETQVLRSIGCPYSASKRKIKLDPPEFLREVGTYEVEAHGCSFCDVAWDKGFCGRLSDEDVLSQIERLPERNGKKVRFELIDEYPIEFLPRLIESVAERGLKLSQIDLVLRVDNILKDRSKLEEAIRALKRRKERLLLSSIGFESYSEKILRNLNKGITVSHNIEAIKILRDLKARYPETFLYRRDEGSSHGFIHPTPWDDNTTQAEILSVIGAYGIFFDVLPKASTPLLIHHGSPLGEWIRRIEEDHGISFRRGLNDIKWWDWKRV